MQITLDGQPVTLEGASLGDVLAAAQAHCEAQGRIVVEVQFNGRALVGTELEQAQAAQLTDASVALLSAKPGELAAEALRGAAQLLDEARSAQGAAALHLQQDDVAEAMTHIGRAIEIWQQTQTAVLQVCQLLNLDLEQLPLADSTAMTQINRLLDQLKELRQLLQAADTVALADALAYEWPDTVDRWQSLLGALIQQVQSD